MAVHGHIHDRLEETVYGDVMLLYGVCDLRTDGDLFAEGHDDIAPSVLALSNTGATVSGSSLDSCAFRG